MIDIDYDQDLRRHAGFELLDRAVRWGLRQLELEAHPRRPAKFVMVRHGDSYCHHRSRRIGLAAEMLDQKNRLLLETFHELTHAWQQCRGWFAAEARPRDETVTLRRPGVNFNNPLTYRIVDYRWTDPDTGHGTRILGLKEDMDIGAMLRVALSDRHRYCLYFEAPNAAADIEAVVAGEPLCTANRPDYAESYHSRLPWEKHANENARRLRDRFNQEFGGAAATTTAAARMTRSPMA